MARSVSTHPASVEDVHLHGIIFDSDIVYPPDYDFEAETEPLSHYFDWDEFLDDLKGVVKERYPSFDDADRWEGHENHVILENGAAEVSVANYCGLIAVSLAPKDGDFYDEGGYDFSTTRNATWTGRIASNFGAHLRKRFESFAMISFGRASNGEEFFRPANRLNGLVTSKEGELW